MRLGINYLITGLAILLTPALSYAASWGSVGVSLQNSGVAYDWQTDPSNTGNEMYPGWSSYQSVMGSWNGSALDTTRNRMLFWGGGHSAYAGNEMYAFDFDTNEWSIVIQPDTFAEIELDSETGPDCTYGDLTVAGSPKTIHSYDGVDYYAQLDSWCSNFGAMGAVGCQSPGPKFMCYSFTTDTWTTSGFAATTSGGADMYGAIDPLTKLWYGAGSGNDERSRFSKYDPSTDTRLYGDGVSRTGLYSTYNKNFAIDYRRQRGVLTSQNYDTIFYVDYEPFVVDTTRLGPNEYTFSGDSAWYDTGSSREVGIDYDPVLDKMILFDSGEGLGVYALDTATGAVVELTPTGGPPPDDVGNGVFSRFKYIPSINKFALAQSVEDPVYLLTLTELTDLTTVTLNSTGGDTDYPLTVGHGFKKGDVPNAQEVAFRLPDGYILPTSYECKKTWNDGSCKHAIMSAIVPKLEAGVDLELGVTTSPDLTEGRTDLAESDIVTAAPVVTVSFSGQAWTTVSLSSLLGSPDRVFLAGPDVVEAHYSQDVVENSDFVVKFYVRYYSTGDAWVRVGIENGVLDGTNEDTYTTYTPTITIGGSTAYNSSVDHYRNTRYVVEGWINTSHTDTYVKIDPTYLMATKLVPNYWKTGASDAALNDLTQTYTPLIQGDLRQYFSLVGAASQIGILPNWEGLYFSSQGDERAYNATVANSKALNTYGIVWRDPSTDMPIVIETGTEWDDWSYNGDGVLPSSYVTRNSRQWEIHHHGSEGYLAYILTGDYYHLETLQYLSTMCWLQMSAAYGYGTNKYWKSEARGLAWTVRTIGQLAAISPTEPISTDLRAWLDFQISYLVANNVGANELGFYYRWSAGNVYDGGASMFMQDFLVMVMGYLHDLEPLSDLTDLTAVRDDGYKTAVGILGPGGAGNYCFGYAGESYIYVHPYESPSIQIVEEDFFDSWGDVWTTQCGMPDEDVDFVCPDPITSCPNTLTSEGSNSSSPSNPDGYWANLLPAIAYAVEDGAAGAADSWARLTGADNWSDVENAGFEDAPVWGIYPRDVAEPAPISRRVDIGVGVRVLVGTGTTVSVQ